MSDFRFARLAPLLCDVVDLDHFRTTDLGGNLMTHYSKMDGSAEAVCEQPLGPEGLLTYQGPSPLLAVDCPKCLEFVGRKEGAEDREQSIGLSTGAGKAKTPAPARDTLNRRHHMTPTTPTPTDTKIAGLLATEQTLESDQGTLATAIANAGPQDAAVVAAQATVTADIATYKAAVSDLIAQLQADLSS
jgi:hypothetical protein